jgi:hypothetical protein
MRAAALCALALVTLGCKPKPPPEAVVITPTVEDEPPQPPREKPKRDDPVPGGSDEEEIGVKSAERTAREWLRAARADDDIKLIAISPSLSEPHSGATLDDDAARKYYGELCGTSHDWVGQKPQPVTHERVARFVARNKVDADLKRAVANANFVVAADPPPDASAILLTIYNRKGDFYVASAVEIRYRGELP